MGVLVVLLLLLFTKPGYSQSNDDDSNTNFFIGMFCGRGAMTSLQNFVNVRNTTFNDLRTQLSRNGSFYARAQVSNGGDTIYAIAQCRNFISVDQCLTCFDAGVSRLDTCTSGIGGFVSFDNCLIRFENYADFYTNPYVTDDANRTPNVICGNQSASQPTVYNQVVDGFLSDIRDATPKISNYYVASTRQITGENTTVYVTGQCVENTSRDSCQTCMDTAYDRLNDCLPSTKGTFFLLGCFARYSDTPFFGANQTIDITNYIKGNSSKVGIIAGVIAGVVVIIVVILSLLLYRSWKKSKKSDQDFEGAVHYDYKDLQLATNNFSEENILGRGGFGEVFKAVFDENNMVAVKKLYVQHARAKEEFENEVKLISNIHHRNLLRLLGWSIEGSYLLLVLEYMPNGSLDRFLWGSKRGTLNWNQRYEIILGIARGLVHLHDEFHIKILHRDIKSSNILLTDDFKPKIADFGLAKLQPEDKSHISTKFAGTLGYTAPEYANYGVLSEKVDTYSFGIVILEIISGRRSTEVNVDSQVTDYGLLEHTWKLYEKKLHTKVIDATLNLNQLEQEQVTKIIEIALLCTQSPASVRPTMSEVVLMLQEGQSLGERQLTRPTLINNQARRIYMGSSRPKDMQATQQPQS